MKNDKLDKLTELAKDAQTSLPDLLIDGRGQFVHRNGNAASNHEVLSLMTVAREKVDQLSYALINEPRRKVVKKKK